MKEKAKEILKSQAAPSPSKPVSEAKESEETEVKGKGKFTAEELEERKKQLEMTRNLIMKKRMEERKKELVDYEQKQNKKDDFYLKLMEMERQRKDTKDQTKVAEEEEKVSPEKRAEAEAKKKQIMKEAQLSVFKDLKKERIEEERAALQKKIKEVEDKIAAKKGKIPVWSVLS